LVSVENDSAPTVDQEAGGSSPPSCTIRTVPFGATAVFDLPQDRCGNLFGAGLLGENFPFARG
jgi:hypothetical protein